MVPFVLLGLLPAQLSSAPSLESPQAVAIRVSSVQWSPRGDALLYARPEGNDLALGLFALGDPEGKVVLRLPASDRWQAQWFEGAGAVLVTATQETSAGKAITLYLLSSARKTATAVFARSMPAGQTLDVEANLSPSLLHAIITLREGQTTLHYVLPLGGGPLVPAKDIDQAEAKGLAGPSWSQNGTALFGTSNGTALVRALAANDASGNSTVVLDGQSFSEEGGQFKVNGNLMATLSESLSNEASRVSFYVRFMPPAPPVGKAALEVVPTNGVLRPIRSPGPWQGESAPPLGFATEGRSLKVQAEGLVTDSKGLCLVGGTKTKPWRTVVTPRSEWGALAPWGGAVAYLTDGALFVRRFARH